MELASRILGHILSWSSFMPFSIQIKIRNWIDEADRILSVFEKVNVEIYKKLADATLELHTRTRNAYLSLENVAKQNRRTASLWDHHLKFPLNSALRTLRSFSQRLQSRAQNEREMVATDMAQLVLDAYVTDYSANQQDDTPIPSSTVYRGLRDLSSEVRLLGDFPAAQGVVSSIWLGELADDIRVAVKLFIPACTVALRKEFLREARMWSRAMHHENVMPLLGVAHLRDSVALVSPWMPEGDLHTYLKSHPDANRLGLLADVARGLAYIHSQGIVYGNLLSSTVLVSSTERAYLSSFLVAHAQEGDEFATTNILNWRVISPGLLVPEDVPLSVERRMLSTPESDSFAFGTIMMETLTENSPHRYNRSGAIKYVLEGKLPPRPRFLEEQGLTDDLWHLVIECWHRDPAKRPTMAEVAHRMVQLAEVFTPLSDTIKPRTLPRMLKDISAEIKKLGEHPIAGGGYCDLYLGERLGSEKVALKLVRLFGCTGQDKDSARRRFLSEARLWAELEHPRILDFYGVCEYGTMSLFMVSPYLEHGNIMSFLTLNPDGNRLRLLSEAAEGLLYLHERRPPVVHGDLKGANILITTACTAVLADFGLSKISHDATTTMLQGAGSPRWMAPELILAGEDITGPLKTQKSDVYAFGHVMLEVLSNQRPFFNLKEDLHVIVDLIHGGRSPRPHGPVAEKWLDDAAWTFSRQCSAIDPQDRPGIGIVASELYRLRENIHWHIPS